MALSLSKEAYVIDSSNLYRVSSEVSGVHTRFVYQCLQSKSDSEIEDAIVIKLLEKGYASGELTPVNWS